MHVGMFLEPYLEINTPSLDIVLVYFVAIALPHRGISVKDNGLVDKVLVEEFDQKEGE